MNIIDYVMNTKSTFDRLPLNSVDSLVLCQLSYIKFENVIDERNISCSASDKRRIRDFYKSEFFDKMFCDSISDEKNMMLFAAAAASPRFRDIIIKNISVDFNPKIEKQFAAMTFVIDKNTEYVAFRGTDGTLIGWKEDFNMAFTDVVPSQSQAADYIDRNYGKKMLFAQPKRIYIGGHSKGGNLAEYGALMSKPEIHKNIIEIFSHDGPGFRQDVLLKLEDVKKRDGLKINKQVPQSSLIGMLLQSQVEYRVVKSTSTGLMQHSAFSWQIDGNDFVYKENLAYGGEFFDKTMQDWLVMIDDDERKLFVDSVYEILTKNNINTYADVKNLSPKQIKAIYDDFSEADDEKKKVTAMVIKSLIKIAFKTALNVNDDQKNK